MIKITEDTVKTWVAEFNENYLYKSVVMTEWQNRQGYDIVIAGQTVSVSTEEIDALFSLIMLVKGQVPNESDA